MNTATFPVIALGDDAFTVLCGPGEIRHSLARYLTQERSWMEVVPGKQDLTVVFDPHSEDMDRAMARLNQLLQSAGASLAVAPRTHSLTAEFGGDDGPDLSAIAERQSLTEAQVIDAVMQSVLIVDMLGFTPGFAYLTGLSPMLTAQRLATPRPRVASGSIGVITGQAGLYALEGPGGWPIIGRLDAPLFDRAAPEPFRLAPGDRVVLRRSGEP